ncbi:uncharacterized protein BYT42DRAFT_603931 [Radiomyces spectabilis]|uniref:uncharacterized protein n=1 Tax=Radiomyces spectabilis TaxID=64574 RepID=UPI00221FA2F1|nr:uncharacterized protein BYT42DRAFT_603931 [Radiomyces spectabilis]KAI8385024.1 hypothetical protein BYT42DRAFT_603931 [Radiomyces spectabilis]
MKSGTTSDIPLWRTLTSEIYDDALLDRVRRKIFSKELPFRRIPKWPFAYARGISGSHKATPMELPMEDFDDSEAVEQGCTYELARSYKLFNDAIDNIVRDVNSECRRASKRRRWHCGKESDKRRKSEKATESKATVDGDEIADTEVMSNLDSTDEEEYPVGVPEDASLSNISRLCLHSYFAMLDDIALFDEAMGHHQPKISWKAVLSSALATGIPAVVVDSVRKRMENLSKDKYPEICDVYQKHQQESNPLPMFTEARTPEIAEIEKQTKTAAPPWISELLSKSPEEQRKLIWDIEANYLAKHFCP